MRGNLLLPVRSFSSTSYRYASASAGILTVQARLSAPVVNNAANGRKSFSTYSRRLSQEPKTFTRHTFPRSIRIDRADDMTITERKRTRRAYVALGSNLGDRIAEIERACREMEARGIRLKRTSSLWETEPMYYAEQDRFVNGVCEVSEHICPCGGANRLTRRNRSRPVWSRWNCWTSCRMSRTQWDGRK